MTSLSASVFDVYAHVYIGSLTLRGGPSEGCHWLFSSDVIQYRTQGQVCVPVYFGYMNMFYIGWLTHRGVHLKGAIGHFFRCQEGYTFVY